ncbi:MAG: histidine phosphatase family protein [Angustibacter sp.]
MSSSEAARDWPASLVLVRHGESIGNLEARRAAEAGRARLQLDYRDPDTPLSDAGRRQAEALGRWWAERAGDERPDVVLTSPYRRAADTARTAVEAAGMDLDVRADERLRERDLGAFDGLTASGIKELYEAEAERRARTGKLYYRPPGGESWCDVALRVRSLLLTWREEYAGRRMAVFTHQAVIMCHRLVLEGLSEDVLLEADRGDPLANCAMTTYRLGAHGGLELVRYNDTAAVERSAEAPLTEEPDADAPDAKGA